MTATSHAIAVAYNQPLSGMTNIDLIVPSSDQAFADPKSIPFYTRGQRNKKLNMLPYRGGYAGVSWEFGILTYRQWQYLTDTYCGGGSGAFVTVYTTMGNFNFYRMNAIMEIKDPNEMRATNWYVPGQVKFTFTGVAS